MQFLVFFGAILLLLSGCVRDKVTGKKQFSLENWSVAEERRLGEESAPNIEATYDGVYPDREAHEVLGEIVDDMVALSVRSDDFDWQFKIVNTSEINAFAMPGGFVYITRGLIERLESEAEFVFVLGHELGHVEHQHAMFNQSRQRVAGVLNAPILLVARVGRILPGPAESAVNLAAGIAITPTALSLLRYSRKQESRADERGVFFAAELGYDPRDSELLFSMFQEVEEEHGGGGPEWLRSHPLNEDRIAEVNQTIRRDYPELIDQEPSEFNRTSPRFQQVIDQFRRRAPFYRQLDEATAQVTNPDVSPADFKQAKEQLEAVRTQLPEEPLVAIALGEAAVVEADAEAAEDYFEQAIELYKKRLPHQSHWKPHFFLGAINFERQAYDAAISHLQEARRWFPLQPVTHWFLGRAYEESGEKQRAKAAYDEVVRLTPSDSELHQEAKQRSQELG